jgi:flagellar biosynthesis component FlhA
MSDNGPGFQIDAMLAQQMIASISDQMENLARTGHFPILLCPRELRLAIHKLVDQSLSTLVIVAFSEVSTGTKVKAYGTVTTG